MPADTVRLLSQLSLLFLFSVSAPLTVNPSNTVAVVGSSVTVINCSSDLPDSVDWWWVRAGETRFEPIYQASILVDIYDKHRKVYIYNKHMKVIRGEKGEQNLFIFNVTFKHAGNYTCFDEGRLPTAVDKGYYASAELVVIGYLCILFI